MITVTCNIEGAHVNCGNKLFNILVKIQNRKDAKYDSYWSCNYPQRVDFTKNFHMPQNKNIPLRERPFTIHVTDGTGLPYALHLMGTSAPMTFNQLLGSICHLGGSVTKEKHKGI